VLTIDLLRLSPWSIVQRTPFEEMLDGAGEKLLFGMKLDRACVFLNGVDEYY
jgi:hypothetical protein